jgi:plastocyanin
MKPQRRLGIRGPSGLIAFAIAVALPISLQFPALADDDSGPQTRTIGVDNTGSQPAHPFWSYTDFFTRSVDIHSGDTLHFRVDNAFHVLALAKSESVARTDYPLLIPDEQAGGETALGPGGPRILLGPAFGPASPFAPPPSCGRTQVNPCPYRGGNPPAEVVESPALGGPPAVQRDWYVRVDAPAGTYNYFCFIHPGMNGTVRVGERRTSQAEIDTRAASQFQRDERAAVKAEAQASKVTFTGDEPGTRTYIVHGGVNAADNHVSIVEMLPSHLNLVQGDRVKFVMQNNEPHSFTFPATNDALPGGPFVPDCGLPDSILAPPPAPPFCGDPGQPPEFITDPGYSPSGTVLTNPANLIDSGVLVGAGYRMPTPTTWTVATTASTAPTSGYNYHCIIHDFMAGTFDVAAASSSEGD